MTKTTLISLATASALALTLAACGGNSSSSNGSTTPPSGGAAGAPPASTAMLTAGDAPMANVLAVQVTLSSVTATAADGSAVNLLSSPTTVELSHLGETRALIATAPLPQGTYNGMSATVSAVKVTYLDSSSAVVTADSTATTPTATINSGTVSATFSSPAVVNYQNAADVSMDFDLSKSLDLDATAGVSFTPTVSFGIAQVASESTAASTVVLNGTVTATGAANNTISLTTDSGYKATLNVTADTAFDNVNSLATLKTGARVRSDAALDASGATLTALTVESVDNGTAESSTKDIGTAGSPNVVANGRVDAGVVTAVTGSPATAFTLAVQNSSAAKAVGTTITVNVAAGTVFQKAQDAAAFGDAVAFDGTQIGVGNRVWVAGTFDPTVTGGPITAAQVQQLPVAGAFSTTAAVTTTLDTDGTTVLSYAIPAAVVSAGAAVVGSTLTISAQTCASSTGTPPCSATALSGAPNPDKGNDLDAKHILLLATGTKLNARGYIGGAGAATLYAIQVNDPTGVSTLPKS